MSKITTIKEFKTQVALGTMTPEMQRALMINPNTPTELLVHFAKARSRHHRRNIAKNLNTPRDLLSTLLKDKCKSVREGVMENPNISPEKLCGLIKKQSRGMRQRIAGSISTNIMILRMLLADTSQSVRETALTTVERRKESIRKKRRRRVNRVRKK